MILQIPLTPFGATKQPEVEITLEKTGEEDDVSRVDSAISGENIHSGGSLAFSSELQLDNNMNKPLPNNNDTRANARVINIPSCLN